VRDLDAGTTTLVDRDSGAVGTVPARSSSDATIDADGGRVAWSTSGAIAGAPGDGKSRVFVRDLRTRVTTLVSRVDGTDGAPADGTSIDPSIDAAGDVVAFSSDAPNLGAKPNKQQVFVRNVANGTTTLASRLPGTDELPDVARNPAIDAAGDRVSFAAGSFGPPASFQVHVRDLPSATTEIASRADGADGAPADSTFIGNSSLTANGDCVAFDGNFTKLDDGLASRDFGSVHMRVLRGECPAPRPDTGPAGGGPAGGGPDTTAGVVLSSLKVDPRRFWVKGFRSGTTIQYTLSQAARVTLRFDRLTKGRRKGRRCVARGHGKACTIIKRAGTLTLKGKAGPNRQRFSGKLRGKPLGLGRYRVTATVASGRARTVGVAIIRAPQVKRR
jgi:hypothetical protein